ncbi:hypothetical protein J437_LFUL001644 [Ladona fulva]|uniref:ESF1 RRM domain-containing protein n=1 Tax=Ladona fulva TaxID=123851 RepID=A0A8K0JY60_LADFU|nr:hypothetical protein J437_LFUL001644 [Ladona fulva]
MENIIKDSRFAHIATDPRFRKVPKYDRKVKIDKRFQSMFTDDKFKVKYSVDKRGKPINYISSENLQKYYSLSSGEDSSEQEDESSPVANVKDEQEAAKDSSCKPGENSDCVSSDLSVIKDCKTENGEPKSARTIDKFGFIVSDISDKVCVKKAQVRNDIPDQIKRKLLNLDIDYARGEGILLSDSSSDDESSDDAVAEFEEEMAHAWGELDKEATTTELSTNRLAVCNMDWDRIKATDLMVLFSSFTPREGFVKSIAVYFY